MFGAKDSRALRAKLGLLCGFWTPGPKPVLHCGVSQLGAAPVLCRRNSQVRPQEEGHGGNGERQSRPPSAVPLLSTSRPERPGRSSNSILA